MKIVDQLPVEGRRVFVRVDFNVPLEKTADEVRILDDTRIRAVLPTLISLRERKAKIILASHLGRPKGNEAGLSLIEVAKRLSELLQDEVIFPEDCVGDAVRKLAIDLREGQVMLLENLRFHKEEEANDPQFAETLAHLAEIYVTEAFGSLHRTHASTVGMVAHFKEKGIGFLVKKEIDGLQRLLRDTERPYYAVLGGAKVTDKIALIENLLTRVDGLLLGGGLALTFLKAKGTPIGRSLFEEEKVYTAQKILQKAQEKGIPIHLPVDHRVARGVAWPLPPETRAISVSDLDGEDCAYDIGPRTGAGYEGVLSKARTIFWNGPLGVFEVPAFAEGSYAIARAVALVTTSSGAFSVIGGGESVAAAIRSGVQDKISHLSMGGGATLEYLEGRELPGLKALM